MNHHEIIKMLTTLAAGILCILLAISGVLGFPWVLNLVMSVAMLLVSVAVGSMWQSSINSNLTAQEAKEQLVGEVTKLFQRYWEEGYGGTRPYEPESIGIQLAGILARLTTIERQLSASLTLLTAVNRKDEETTVGPLAGTDSGMVDDSTGAA